MATGIARTELHLELTEMESGDFSLIVIVIFKSNSNYSIVMTIN